MKKERLISLDLFRGITMAAMVLVENPGNWSIYQPFSHASWGRPGEGGLPIHEHITPTDLIFPFFIFIMGVAIAFALGSKKQSAELHNGIIKKVVIRFFSLFGIGLFFYGFPSLLNAILYGSEFHMRIPGVLQRIALVYLVSSVLFLKFNSRTLIWISGVTLIVYWGVVTLIPVPDFGHPEFIRQWYAPENVPKTLLQWLDTKVFGYSDPEGILSTFPAIVTGLSGVLTGVWLRGDKDKAVKTSWMFTIGALLAILGLIWGQFFPVIKDMWTSSYVLITTGLAAMGLAICYWLVDVQGNTRWTRPFLAFGMNSLAVYVTSHIVMSTLRIIRIGADETVHGWIMSKFFESWLEPHNASLLFAFVTVCIWLMPLLYLQKKKIYIKV